MLFKRCSRNRKSLPAYATAVVRSVVNEYKIFETNNILDNVRSYKVGEYFMEYANCKNVYDVQLNK